MKKSLLGAAVCAALGFSAAAQAGVVIDLFTDPVGGFQQVTTQTLGATDFSQTGPFPTTSVIGGYRDVSITKTGDTLGGPNTGAATMTVDSGVLSFNNADGVTSLGVVTWDGANAAGAGGTGVLPTGFGGVGIDLTAGGSASQFLTSILSADLGFNYKITVWDMDGDKSELSAGVQFQVNAPVGAGYLFSWFNLSDGRYCAGSPYSPPPETCDPFTQLDFTIARTGGPIDFQRIGALQFSVVGARGDVDLALGSIATVPEPGALALVGVALMGAGIASRRRFASKA
jgi:hypothetical protein